MLVEAIQLVPSDTITLPAVAEALGNVGVDQTGAVDEPLNNILFAVAVPESTSMLSASVYTMPPSEAVKALPDPPYVIPTTDAFHVPTVTVPNEAIDVPPA
jgi:hypothetical protein